jgi:hypothetical protein
MAEEAALAVLLEVVVGDDRSMSPTFVSRLDLIFNRVR